MSVLRWLASQLYPLAVMLWINALILRLTVRDSFDLLAPLYYATPWPVIILLTLPVLWQYRRVPNMVFGGIVIVHVFLGMWIMEGWRSGQASKEPADLKLAVWNVARPKLYLDGIIESLKELDADVIALAEPLRKDGSNRDAWEKAFPEYQVVWVPGNMACLVRGEVTKQAFGNLGRGSFYGVLDVTVKERSFRILQIDIQGAPRSPRRGPLTQLAQITDKLQDQRLIVCGDFNTPRDSVHLKGLRERFRNSFETAGIGSGETWPLPLPVLSLDQVWTSAGLKTVRNSHPINFRSDHRAVVAELKFEEPAVTSAAAE